MKAFGYKDNSGSYGDSGITCGVIFADSIEEAKTLMDFDDWSHREVFELPMTKGYHFIGDYEE